jgi:hypothetical protein
MRGIRAGLAAVAPDLARAGYDQARLEVAALVAAAEERGRVEGAAKERRRIAGLILTEPLMVVARGDNSVTERPDFGCNGEREPNVIRQHGT